LTHIAVIRCFRTALKDRSMPGISVMFAIASALAVFGLAGLIGATVILADAKIQAAQMLTNATKTLASVPAAMRLRHRQTLREIGSDQNSPVAFPMLINIIKPFLDLLEQPADSFHSKLAGLRLFLPAAQACGE
jgi:hypothetical protein